jgi:hypothetical protein
LECFLGPSSEKKREENTWKVLRYADELGFEDSEKAKVERDNLITSWNDPHHLKGFCV